jgi:putative effector of murein hydrolase
MHSPPSGPARYSFGRVRRLASIGPRGSSIGAMRAFGVPGLTAFFVVVTGFVGTLLGDAMLSWLPVHSSIARGAFLGMSAHGAGTAKAYQLGRDEGAVAGIVMILGGLLNVAVSPLFVLFLRSPWT